MAHLANEYELVHPSKSDLMMWNVQKKTVMHMSLTLSLRLTVTTDKGCSMKPQFMFHK